MLAIETEETIQLQPIPKCCLLESVPCFPRDRKILPFLPSLHSAAALSNFISVWYKCILSFIFFVFCCYSWSNISAVQSKSIKQTSLFFQVAYLIPRVLFICMFLLPYMIIQLTNCLQNSYNVLWIFLEKYFYICMCIHTQTNCHS